MTTKKRKKRSDSYDEENFIDDACMCNGSWYGDRMWRRRRTKTSSSTSDSGKKKLTAANVDYAPFEFYEDGKPVGFDVDLWSAICDKLGYEAEFVHYPWMV